MHGQEPDFQELSARILQIIRPHFKPITTIVIDKSMVSSRMLTFIHRRLITLKQKDDFFGGLNVILVGDFYQLRPVRGYFAFENSLLWNLFSTFTLSENQ